MKTTWILRALAVAGLVISLYLLTLKLTGKISYLVGCGEGSGCANVLGSRWSQFFYIPVSAFAAAMYAALLLATWKPSRPVFAGLAICFAGAAFWFYGILLVELKAFCPWCAAAHAIGLTCAGVLAWSLKKHESMKGNAYFGVIGGLFGVLVLVFGQIMGPVPATHAESKETVEKEDRNLAVHARGKGRVVSVFDDRKFYNTSTLPHLGSPDAPHVVVKYFDYTCASCKDMHDDLAMVAEKHPGQFCMIMLPVPLNRSCNPHFPPGIEDHDHACELSRLALAAWRADPGAFPEVHEILFTRPVLPPEVAEIAVAQIVGEEALAKARQDPWIEEVLEANLNDFRQLVRTTVRMPKLLVGKDRMLHGITKTPEVLLQAMEKEFKLPAAP